MQKYSSNIVASTVRTLAADRGNFSKLSANDIVTNSLTLVTAPRIITIGQAPFLTIQSAIDSLAGLQAQDTIIDVPAGTYNETLRLDNLSSSLRLNYDPVVGLQDVESRGLMLRGDTRPFVGVTYMGGGYNTAAASHVWDSMSAPTQIVAYDPPLGTGYGAVQLNNTGPNKVQMLMTSAPFNDKDDLIDLPGSIVQPDFPTLGVVVGDQIIIRDDVGILSRRTITAVSGNEITFDGALVTFDNNGSSITFLPNVHVYNNTAHTNTCVVCDTSLTMKGFEFEIGPNGYNVRANLLLSGAAVLQTPNCVFNDILSRSENCVIVQMGSTWVNADRSQGRQLITPDFAGVPVDYPYNDISFMPLPVSIIGGANPNINNIGASVAIFGGSIQYGNYWIIQDVNNPVLGLIATDAGNLSYLSDLHVCGALIALYIRARTIYVRSVLCCLKTIFGAVVQFGAHLSKEFGLTKLTGREPGNFGTALLLLGGGYTAPLQFNAFDEGFEVSDFANWILADDASASSCGFGQTHKVTNMISTVMAARANGRIDFADGTTIALTNCPGALSRSWGFSHINLNQTNLTDQGIWVYTASASHAESPEAQAFDAAVPITVTLNPTFSSFGQLCLAGRIFYLYNRGPLAAHQLVLSSGVFLGAGGAFTTATLNAANDGEGLTFSVISSTQVQVIGSTGVTFS